MSPRPWGSKDHESVALYASNLRKIRRPFFDLAMRVIAAWSWIEAVRALMVSDVMDREREAVAVMMEAIRGTTVADVAFRAVVSYRLSEDDGEFFFGIWDAYVRSLETERNHLAHWLLTPIVGKTSEIAMFPVDEVVANQVSTETILETGRRNRPKTRHSDFKKLSKQQKNSKTFKSGALMTRATILSIPDMKNLVRRADMAHLVASNLRMFLRYGDAPGSRAREGLLAALPKEPLVLARYSKES